MDRCKTYHAVEKQHCVEHLNLNPDFEPKDPIVHIILRDPDKGTEIEWDVQGCKSFDKDLGRWLRLRPNQKLPT